MLSFRLVMIHSDPATTTVTIEHPKRQRQNVVGVVRPCRDVQEENQVHTHLGDRERGEAEEECRVPRAETCSPTQNDVAVRTNGETQPDRGDGGNPDAVSPPSIGELALDRSPGCSVVRVDRSWPRLPSDRPP